jgi:uncharacterized Zn finger protein
VTGFRRFGYLPRSRPRPVEGGIKARSLRGDIGETWWSQRFIAILESFGFGSRLERGRSYARRGQVLELEVKPGEVSARVQGSRARPYRIRIAVKTLSERDWGRAEKAMASRAVFAAKLLAGEMPQQIEEAFEACKLSLFPASGRELASSCTCPDWASPCKHVAAVFYLLAEAFDSNPFLVFTWRGRIKDELIERLRLLRSTTADLPVWGRNEQPGTELGSEPPLASCLDRFWESGPGLEHVTARPRAAAVPDALIRQLGPSGVKVGRQDLANLLAGLYADLTSEAERRALNRG